MRSLELLRESLERTPTSLPLDPALEVCGIDVPACSYFPSNTLPLRVQFRSAEDDGEPLPVIYKVGDDLRQDMLTIQMIRIMDKLWLKEGLDLRMVTFNCVPTGHCRGETRVGWWGGGLMAGMTILKRCLVVFIWAKDRISCIWVLG